MILGVQGWRDSGDEFRHRGQHVWLGASEGSNLQSMRTTVATRGPSPPKEEKFVVNSTEQMTASPTPTPTAPPTTMDAPRKSPDELSTNGSSREAPEHQRFSSRKQASSDSGTTLNQTAHPVGNPKAVPSPTPAPTPVAPSQKTSIDGHENQVQTSPGEARTAAGSPSEPTPAVTPRDSGSGLFTDAARRLSSEGGNRNGTLYWTPGGVQWAQKLGHWFDDCEPEAASMVTDKQRTIISTVTGSIYFALTVGWVVRQKPDYAASKADGNIACNDWDVRLIDTHYEKFVLEDVGPKIRTEVEELRGMPEMFLGGEWHPICPHYFQNTPDGASVVCGMMGYATGYIHNLVNKTIARDSVFIQSCGSHDLGSLQLCTDGGPRPSGAFGVDECRAGQARAFEIGCTGVSKRKSSCGQRLADMNIWRKRNTGTWGGRCTCPNGQVYLVGDRADNCASLACIGGVPGRCSRFGIPKSARHTEVRCANLLQLTTGSQCLQFDGECPKFQKQGQQYKLATDSSRCLTFNDAENFTAEVCKKDSSQAFVRRDSDPLWCASKTHTHAKYSQTGCVAPLCVYCADHFPKSNPKAARKLCQECIANSACRGGSNVESWCSVQNHDGGCRRTCCERGFGSCEPGQGSVSCGESGCKRLALSRGAELKIGKGETSACMETWSRSIVYLRGPGEKTEGLPDVCKKDECHPIGTCLLDLLAKYDLYDTPCANKQDERLSGYELPLMKKFSVCQSACSADQFCAGFTFVKGKGDAHGINCRTHSIETGEELMLPVSGQTKSAWESSEDFVPSAPTPRCYIKRKMVFERRVNHICLDVGRVETMTTLQSCVTKCRLQENCAGVSFGINGTCVQCSNLGRMSVSLLWDTFVKVQPYCANWYLVAIVPSKCPMNPAELPYCQNTGVAAGRMCQADGECGIRADFQNCGKSAIYRKEENEGALPLGGFKFFAEDGQTNKGYAVVTPSPEGVRLDFGRWRKVPDQALYGNAWRRIQSRFLLDYGVKAYAWSAASDVPYGGLRFLLSEGSIIVFPLEYAELGEQEDNSLNDQELEQANAIEAFLRSFSIQPFDRRKYRDALVEHLGVSAWDQSRPKALVLPQSVKEAIGLPKGHATDKWKVSWMYFESLANVEQRNTDMQHAHNTALDSFGSRPGQVWCEDGIILTPVQKNVCPDAEVETSCDEAFPGQLCVGNGVCSTNAKLNNCLAPIGTHGNERIHDGKYRSIYIKQPACSDGMQLFLLPDNTSLCPSQPGVLGPCDSAEVGDQCEAVGGECGTNGSARNCVYDTRSAGVYVKLGPQAVTDGGEHKMVVDDSEARAIETTIELPSGNENESDQPSPMCRHKSSPVADTIFESYIMDPDFNALDAQAMFLSDTEQCDRHLPNHAPFLEKDPLWRSLRASLGMLDLRLLVPGSQEAWEQRKLLKNYTADPQNMVQLEAVQVHLMPVQNVFGSRWEARVRVQDLVTLSSHRKNLFLCEQRIGHASDGQCVAKLEFHPVSWLPHQWLIGLHTVLDDPERLWSVVFNLELFVFLTLFSVVAAAVGLVLIILRNVPILIRWAIYGYVDVETDELSRLGINIASASDGVEAGPEDTVDEAKEDGIYEAETFEAGFPMGLIELAIELFYSLVVCVGGIMLFESLTEDPSSYLACFMLAVGPMAVHALVAICNLQVCVQWANHIDALKQRTFLPLPDEALHASLPGRMLLLAAVCTVAAQLWIKGMQGLAYAFACVYPLLAAHMWRTGRSEANKPKVQLKAEDDADDAVPFQRKAMLVLNQPADARQQGADVSMASVLTKGLPACFVSLVMVCVGVFVGCVSYLNIILKEGALLDCGLTGGRWLAIDPFHAESTLSTAIVDEQTQRLVLKCLPSNAAVSAYVGNHTTSMTASFPPDEQNVNGSVQHLDFTVTRQPSYASIELSINLTQNVLPIHFEIPVHARRGKKYDIYVVRVASDAFVEFSSSVVDEDAKKKVARWEEERDFDKLINRVDSRLYAPTIDIKDLQMKMTIVQAVCSPITIRSPQTINLGTVHYSHQSCKEVCSVPTAKKALNNSCMWSRQTVAGCVYTFQSQRSSLSAKGETMAWLLQAGSIQVDWCKWNGVCNRFEEDPRSSTGSLERTFSLGNQKSLIAGSGTILDTASGKRYLELKGSLRKYMARAMDSSAVQQIPLKITTRVPAVEVKLHNSCFVYSTLRKTFKFSDNPQDSEYLVPAFQGCITVSLSAEHQPYFDLRVLPLVRTGRPVREIVQAYQVVRKGDDCAANKGVEPWCKQYTHLREDDADYSFKITAQSFLAALQAGNLYWVKRLLHGFVRKKSKYRDILGLFGDNSPLPWTAQWGHVGIMNELLEQLGKDADPNECEAKTSDWPGGCARELGLSSLMVASRCGHLGVAARLLSARADINHKSPSNEHQYPLEQAVQGGHLDMVKYLVALKADLPQKVKNSKHDPLSASIRQGRVDVLQFLLSTRADPRVIVDGGLSLLTWAVGTTGSFPHNEATEDVGHQIVKTLLEARAGDSENSDYRANKLKVTAFQRVACDDSEQRAARLMKLLLDNQVNTYSGLGGPRFSAAELLQSHPHNEQSLKIFEEHAAAMKHKRGVEFDAVCRGLCSSVYTNKMHSSSDFCESTAPCVCTGEPVKNLSTGGCKARAEGKSVAACISECDARGFSGFVEKADGKKAPAVDVCRHGCKLYEDICHTGKISDCNWTVERSCPDQPLGLYGRATDDGRDEYYCCCTLGMWKAEKYAFSDMCEAGNSEKIAATPAPSATVLTSEGASNLCQFKPLNGSCTNMEHHPLVSTWQECQELCCKTPTCKVWQWNDVHRIRCSMASRPDCASGGTTVQRGGILDCRHQVLQAAGPGYIEIHTKESCEKCSECNGYGVIGSKATLPCEHCQRCNGKPVCSPLCAERSEGICNGADQNGELRGLHRQEFEALCLSDAECLGYGYTFSASRAGEDVRYLPCGGNMSGAIWHGDPPSDPWFAFRKQACVELQDTWRPDWAEHGSTSQANCEYCINNLDCRGYVSEEQWCASLEVAAQCGRTCCDLTRKDPHYTDTAAPCNKQQSQIQPGDRDTRTFRCKDGMCLPLTGHCNGIKNCEDGSDEQDCDKAEMLARKVLQEGKAFCHSDRSKASLSN